MTFEIVSLIFLSSLCQDSLPSKSHQPVQSNLQSSDVQTPGISRQSDSSDICEAATLTKDSPCSSYKPDSCLNSPSHSPEPDLLPAHSPSHDTTQEFSVTLPEHSMVILFSWNFTEIEIRVVMHLSLLDIQPFINCLLVLTPVLLFFSNLLWT